MSMSFPPRRPVGSASRSVLVVGPASRRAAAELGVPSSAQLPRESLEGLELPEASLDGAIVLRCLEREPWDRWALQKIHRALERDAALILDAPNLTALLSPSAVTYAVTKALRETSNRVSRALRGRVEPARFLGRRYQLARLVGMLESLGFEVIEWAPSGGPGAALGMKWCDRWRIQAACRASLHGLDASRPYPDPEARHRQFESENRRFLELRDAWLARHPGNQPGEPVAVDVERYRDRDVLVLSPHPDDEIIGCGGTLAKLRAAGGRITIIQATDGSGAASLWDAPEGARRTIRLEEAQRVATALGAQELILWKVDNAAFHCSAENVARLSRTLKTLRPGLVFSPWLTDIHPDHLTFNHILAAAIDGGATTGFDSEIALYEVWGLAPIHRYCVVTDRMAEVERLLLLYETAMKSDDYVHSCEARNLDHGWTATGTSCYAEAFFWVSAKEFPALVQGAGNS
jgi:hypothetical protein